jgi:hypothetical protein
MPPTLNKTILNATINYYKVYWKVPELGQKRNAGLTYTIVSLVTYAAITLYFQCFKSTVEIILLNSVKYCFLFPLDVRHCFEISSCQLYFKFGKQNKITGG